MDKIHLFMPICTNPACQETVFNIGTCSVDSSASYDEGDYEQKYFDIYTPRFFVPHLNIFQIPKNTPDNIKSSIESSFELFFANPSSSAGHIRIALEQFIDYFRVKRFDTRNGKRYSVSLHRRIELLPTKLNSIKELLFAVKWLGNDASHVGGVSIDDVMDAYDIFESVLDEVFSKKSKETKKLARVINKNKGRA